MSGRRNRSTAGAGSEDSRPWRTNLGLRLTRDLGEWFERQCAKENRSFANYMETLILRERARLAGKKG